MLTRIGAFALAGCAALAAHGVEPVTSFRPDTDRLVTQTASCRLFFRPGEQPVYIAEPLDRAAAGTILFVHGLCEHAARNFPTAFDWAARGYRTVTLNLQGHGTELGAPETLEWLFQAYATQRDSSALATLLRARESEAGAAATPVHERNFATLRSTRMHHHLAQIRRVVQDLMGDEADAREPPVLFLAGHSLGGLLATEAGWQLAEHGPVRPTGVILFSPALRPIAPPGSNWLERRGLGLTWAAKRSVWLAPIGWIVNATARLNTRIDTSWASDCFSDLEAARDAQRNDPIFTKALPLSYLNAIQSQMAKTAARARRYPIRTLVIVPDQDPIVDSCGAIAFAQAVAEAHPDAGHRLVEFENLPCHELLRSSKRGETLAIVDEWLAQFQPGAPPEQTE